MSSRLGLPKRNRYKKKKKEPKIKTVIGVDGEGLTLPNSCPIEKHTCDGKQAHQYLYMAACTADELVGELDMPRFLNTDAKSMVEPDGATEHLRDRTQACLEFLLSLPQSALLLGYSLGYDYSKILEGLPNQTLYDVARPENRQGKYGPKPRKWGEWWDDDGTVGWYSLNYMKGRFSVSKILQGEHKLKCNRPSCKGCKSKRKVIVWDIFAFFQGSFIKACKEWGVVTEAEYEDLKNMKDRRSTFDWEEWGSVKAYCQQECRKMAMLGQRLIDAHDDAGLTLTNYYGAGSTASRMLKVKFNAADYIAPPLPEMIEPIACAFFGGRFEVSRVGLIELPCWSYDIASAYPYQFTFLPCLAHGKWELVKKSRDRSRLQRIIEKADIALVHYRLPYCDALKVNKDKLCSDAPWGPFPLRAHNLTRIVKNIPDDQPNPDAGLPSEQCEMPSNGSIIYPVTSGGGWIYKDEFLTGQRHFPNVVADEAWIYHQVCSCRPFNDVGNRATMPDMYLRRLEWGKEGRGIVVKLGTNSCYGKTAQTIGDAPPFQCFIWAGMVTSGCRAQLLEAMATAKQPSSILMTATDGIVSTERLSLAKPMDTGTLEAALAKKKYQLGDWEEKTLPDGVMVIRPGIGFPLDLSIAPADGDMKARGIGKAVLNRHRAEVVRRWKEDFKKGIVGRPFDIERPMFFGMKSSIDPPSKLNKYAKRRANYGGWGMQPQQISYAPFPKRPREMKEDGTLRTWAFGQDVESAPYRKLMGDTEVVELSTEAKLAKEMQRLLDDQPDLPDSDLGDGFGLEDGDT